MFNWLFYKSEYVVYLILGVWYLFQTPVFSRLIIAKFQKKGVRFEDREEEKIHPHPPLKKEGIDLLPSRPLPFVKGGWEGFKNPPQSSFIKGESRKSTFALLGVRLEDSSSLRIENIRIRLVKYGKTVLAAIIAMKIIKAIVLSILQYRSFWGFLKPPFQPSSYVLGYNFTHYWLNTLLTIFIAGIAFFFVQFLNQKYREKFFYEEEYYFCGYGMLAIGWPWSLVYFSSVLLAGVLFHLIKISGILQPLGRLSRKKSDNDKIPGLNPIEFASRLFNGVNANETFPTIAEYRFSFYYLWLALALTGLIILLTF